MAKFLNFTKSVAETSWVVNHDFGSLAAISDVMIDNEGIIEKAIPTTVEHTNNNTITITFTTPQSGYVRIIG